MLNPYPPGRRTLTGAWIETAFVGNIDMIAEVAPSRVRGCAKGHVLEGCHTCMEM